MIELSLYIGDITKLEVDVIVNAANSQLRGGGGVDGAIHAAGGSAIYEECKEIINNIGSLPPGEAVYTSAGMMPSKFVIHTVGPIWQSGNRNEASILKNCYINSLRMAEFLNCSSIAFPGISTGAFGYPIPEAAEIAINAVIEYEYTKCNLSKVIYCCFDTESFYEYRSKLDKIKSENFIINTIQY